MTLTKMPQVGDKVRALNDDSHYITVGAEYEITHLDGDGDANFVDNDGDSAYIDSYCFSDYELVSAEPTQHLGKINIGRFDHRGDVFVVEVRTDTEGFATLQRLDAESDKQARRGVIERQIAELQRELDGLEAIK